MFFTLSNDLWLDRDEKPSHIRELAIERVNACALSQSMRRLDAYMQQHYGRDLKTACRNLILRKTRIAQDAASNTFVVTFVDAESDNLAKLITYGNSEVDGCRLLTFAFDQNY